MSPCVEGHTPVAERITGTLNSSDCDAVHALKFIVIQYQSSYVTNPEHSSPQRLYELL